MFGNKITFKNVKSLFTSAKNAKISEILGKKDIIVGFDNYDEENLVYYTVIDLCKTFGETAVKQVVDKIIFCNNSDKLTTTDSPNQNEMWAKSPVSHACITMFSPFTIITDDVENGVTKEASTETQYTTPKILREYIQHNLAENLGLAEEDIFVSPQIHLAQRVIETDEVWRDYKQQSIDRFAYKQKWTIHKYDEQVLPANTMNYGIYGFFVEINIPVENVLDANAFIDKLRCIHTPGIADSVGKQIVCRNELYQEIHEKASNLTENGPLILLDSVMLFSLIKEVKKAFS